jgi:peptidoglycan hydrolase CwlO-like protein
LLPLFIFAEKKAEDPVINLKYFVNKNIVFTLIISFVSGVVMMGMIFVPEFSENALKIASGSGGYLVIILGVFAGIGAPVSGKLIDRFGAKAILAFGFAVSVIGSLFLILVTTANPNMVTVFISLMLIGIGMGFTIGTPLNYMMLANTDEKESNSSLATLSLIRSIGTAVAPAIMVGFIAHAGMNVQANVMSLLPNEVSVPELPHVEEITEEFNKLKSNPNMQEKLGDMPDLETMKTVKIDMSGDSGYEMPEDLLALMQSSDVTTIVENSKILTERMFGEMTPGVIRTIQNGITKGIEGIGSGIAQMQESVKSMQEGYDGIGQGLEGMNKALEAQKSALTQLKSVQGMTANAGNFPPNMSLADMIPAQVKANIPQDVLVQLAEIKSAEDLNKKIEELTNAIAEMEKQIEESTKSQAEMSAAITGINASVTKMEDMQNKMTVLKDAIRALSKLRKTTIYRR